MDTATNESVTQELPVELRPGDELGHYRILEPLGEGGMGQVFLVEHADLGTRSALKVLRVDLGQPADVARRFLREAKLAASLRHPNIVEVFDFGEDRGRLYYVMEWLEGSSLAKLRELKGPFFLQRTLNIGRQIARALAWVHSKGIVHRDLTPENVFLVQEPEPDVVKLLDFGIAKLAASDAAPTLGPGTQLGMILGTPEFMSPEQAGGRPVDGRSDVYSLGVLLYWMLSSRVPLMGNSFGEIVARRERETPEPLPETTASGDVLPAELRALVGRCLAREPSERPPVDEVVAALSAPVAEKAPVVSVAVVAKLASDAKTEAETKPEIDVDRAFADAADTNLTSNELGLVKPSWATPFLGVAVAVTAVAGVVALAISGSDHAPRTPPRPQARAAAALSHSVRTPEPPALHQPQPAAPARAAEAAPKPAPLPVPALEPIPVKPRTVAKPVAIVADRREASRPPAPAESSLRAPPPRTHAMLAGDVRPVAAPVAAVPPPARATPRAAPSSRPKAPARPFTQPGVDLEDPFAE